MPDWAPSPNTKKEIDWLVEDLFSVAPEVLGIDETITGCRVVALDPYGVGVATTPRYIKVALRDRYHQDVFYRGGLPEMIVGDYLTVVHVREGNRYEVLGAGGGTGATPDPSPTDAEYVVMALDPTLVSERVLTGGDGVSIVDGGAGGAATVDWDAYADQFITLVASGAIPNERVLVARQWLDLTDGGAGGAVTLDWVPDNPARVQDTGVVTEYATIQAAINASVAGDWVAIPPGVYTEALTLKGSVPVTELFRHTVTIRQTTGTYTVQTGGAGTFTLCVHRVEMDQALDTNTGIFAVYANHNSGVFTLIADLYCRNSITIVNGCALGLGNWNAGGVDFTGDVECISTGDYYGCYAVRNDSVGTLVGRGDIISDGGSSGFAYALRNNSTGTLRWWGDLDVDTLGADPAQNFAVGIRTRGGITEWHGYMNIHADNTGARGLYASNGTGTAYLEGRVEVWGLNDSSYGILMGSGAACTTVVTFRGILDVMSWDLHAYGVHTDPTYGDGVIWLHADVYVDGWGVARGISQEGSGTTWHQDGGVDTIGGPMHDLYRSAGILNVSNSRYNRAKTFGTITEMDGDKVGHHKLASVAVNEGASLVGVQDVGGFYVSTEVEGALQEIGGGGVVGTAPLSLMFSWMGF